MRRLATAALLVASFWVPGQTPAVAAATPAATAACTGWTSTTTPPTTIRVLRTATGTVETVDFRTYVKTVMPAEWPTTWPMEVQRAGAITIKQYAWYYAMNYRGGASNGNCFDVVDNTNDQVYAPGARATSLGQSYAVDGTWGESLLRNGSFFQTGYRSGADVPCGSDATGTRLFQSSARDCALAGKSAEEILHTYFDPGLTIQGLPGAPAATTYHPLSPVRLLDTRDGTGGLSGPFSPHAARTFQVAGKAGVPATATAITGNLTVTGQTSPGYLFIGPAATNDPSSSNLNFPAGEDRANAVTAALAGDGTLSITYVAPTPGSTAHVVLDISGYFSPDGTGATYVPVNPTRLLDTRDGTGGAATPLTPGAPRTFQVVGRAGIPAAATAVTGNLTVTQQTAVGYLSIGPLPSASPTSSSLNFPLNDDRANAAWTALGPDGSLSVTLSAVAAGATAHVIFDVTGYFVPDSSGASYFPLAPTRILDTRAGPGDLHGPFNSHSARTFRVSGHAWIPATATAVTANLTVTGQTRQGYLYAGPGPMDSPTSSNLNFPMNDDRANELAVALGSGGMLSITYAAPTTGPTAHVIVDVTGYFAPAAAP